MTIAVGDPIPDVKVKRLGAAGMEEISTAGLFVGKRVVLFSVPGAFTPTCSQKHLPGYVARAAEIRARGVDEIVCLSVNDPWVMKSWGESHDTDGVITMLPDGNGDFTRALGLLVDMSSSGLGMRGRRFSMIVRDGIVEQLAVEEKPGVNVSGADSCLIAL